MSYTRDYIFEKIIEKLPTLKIHEKKEDDSSIFILEYKNSKAKIDIDSFVKKLGNKKNSLSDKKIDEFIYYIVSNFEAQEKISISNLNKEDLLEYVFPVVRSTSFNKDNKQNDSEQPEDKNNPQNNKENGNQEKPSGELSPEQINRILNAINSEEKKTQEKINANKMKGKATRTDRKDW